MSRVVMKDFAFSNGVVVPAGTTIAIPMYGAHHDEATWPDPFKFDPYRSSRMREQAIDDTKHQFVTPTTEFLPWGYGKNAWCVVPVQSGTILSITCDMSAVLVVFSPGMN